MLKLLINKDSFASTLASNRADSLTKDKELVVLAERIAQVKLKEQTFTLKVLGAQDISKTDAAIDRAPNLSSKEQLESIVS